MIKTRASFPKFCFIAMTSNYLNYFFEKPKKVKLLTIIAAMNRLIDDFEAKDTLKLDSILQI